MGRAEVLAEEEQAWTDLMEAVAAVPAEQRSTEGVVPGWTLHDVVWHTAYWVRPGADAVEQIRQGKEAPEDDEVTDAVNESINEDGRSMTWDQVIATLDANRDAGRRSLQAFEGDVPDRALEFFSDYTTDHYREHEEQIRAFVAMSAGAQGEDS